MEQDQQKLILDEFGVSLFEEMIQKSCGADEDIAIGDMVLKHFQRVLPEHSCDVNIHFSRIREFLLSNWLPDNNSHKLSGLSYQLKISHLECFKNQRILNSKVVRLLLFMSVVSLLCLINLFI